jgi:hypothetical protein
MGKNDERSVIIAFSSEITANKSVKKYLIKSGG